MVKKMVSNIASPVQFVTDKAGNGKKSKKPKPKSPEHAVQASKNGGKMKMKVQDIKSPFSAKKQGGKNKKGKLVQPKNEDSDDDDSDEEFDMGDDDSDSDADSDAPVIPVGKKSKKSKAAQPVVQAGKKEGNLKRKAQEAKTASKKQGGKNKNGKQKDDDSSDLSLSDDSNEEFAIDDDDSEKEAKQESDSDSDSESEAEAPVTKKSKKEKEVKSDDPLDTPAAQITAVSDAETLAETTDRIQKRDALTVFIKGKFGKMTHPELLALAPGACDVRTRQNVAYLEFKSEKKAEKAHKHLQSVKVNDEPLVVDFTGSKSKNKNPVKENRSVGEMKIRSLVLYVGGLPSEATESDVKKEFPKANMVRLPITKHVSISSYAYVIFKTAEQAKEAFTQSKDLKINGKLVTVLFAKAHQKKDSRGNKKRSQKNKKGKIE